MSDPKKPFIVVGVTASIAAYKAADLVSKLVKRGCDVHVVMTEHAAEFVGTFPHPSIELLADLFHMSIEERDIAAALQAAESIAAASRGGWPVVGHVHFADSNRRAAGFGHTDFAPIAAALRGMNYGGTVSAEVLPWPDAEAAAAQTMTAFRQHVPRPVS